MAGIGAGAGCTVGPAVCNCYLAVMVQRKRGTIGIRIGFRVALLASNHRMLHRIARPCGKAGALTPKRDAPASKLRLQDGGVNRCRHQVST